MGWNDGVPREMVSIEGGIERHRKEEEWRIRMPCRLCYFIVTLPQDALSYRGLRHDVSEQM